MEVEKVLGIFKELIEEEEEFNIQKILNNLLSHVNSGASKDVENVLSELSIYSNSSMINDYAYSKLKLLEKIEASEFFGKQLQMRILEILNKEVYKVKENLSELITKRNEFVVNVKANIQNLEKLDFESYYDNINNFELGLIIPDSESDMKKVQTYLNDWQFILKTTNEFCDTNHEEPKIYSVSTNSIGIFVVGSITTISLILKIVDQIIKIYERILKIRKLKFELEQEKLTKNIKEVEAKEKEIVLEEKKKILKSIFEESKKLDHGRKKELENHFSKVIDKIILIQDKGVIIEATPPRMPESEILEEEETPENKKEQEKAKQEKQIWIQKTKDITQIASNVTKVMKEITSTGKEILQIAHYLNTEKEEAPQDE